MATTRLLKPVQHKPSDGQPDLPHLDARAYLLDKYADELSQAEQVALLPAAEYAELQSALKPDVKAALKFDWSYWRRGDQVAPPDFRIWAYISGRRVGKLLSLHTMIPTPAGFTKLEELDVGDRVFDENGRPCIITATFDDIAKEAFRLHFSDGTFLDACADHQWVTWDHSARKAYLRNTNTDHSVMPSDWVNWTPIRRNRNGDPVPHEGPHPQVRTTRQIVDSLTQGKRGDLNHCIPVAAPLQIPTADLPVDPWVLGYWLGNGSKRDSSVTTHIEDGMFVQSRLLEAGHRLFARIPKNRNVWQISIRGLTPTLATMGVLDNKHVPHAYLWSSEMQRRSLLAGLMDSDGYNDPNKRSVEFCSTDRPLADAVMHLARSLGQKPVLKEGRAKLYGKDCGPKFRVTWGPSTECFSSPRKTSVTNIEGVPQGFKSLHRMIVAAEPRMPEPMRCLTVDSPNHMYLAGEAMIPTHNTRGFAEYVNERAMAERIYVALVAPTPSDARDIMVEGESGLTKVSPPHMRPTFQPGLKRVTWPNGSWGTIFSGAEPADLRGAGCDLAWVDEPVKFKYLDAAWSNLRFAMSGSSWSGKEPQTLVSSTPAALKFFKDLVAGTYEGTAYTRVPTLRNIANLPAKFLAELMSVYWGTRLGRQEMDAEILDEIEGALWKMEWIEASRVGGYPRLREVVVGVDPSGTKRGDECGIVVCGLGYDDEVYVLGDFSGQYSPDEWGHKVVEAYKFFDADLVLGEGNYGADMVETILRFIDRNIPFKKVNASRGKDIRAAPIASLWERRDPATGGLKGVGHMVGRFPELENELTEWVPDESGWSPGRLDGLVIAATHLAWNELSSGNAGMLAPRRRIETVSVNRAAGMLPAGIMAGIASPPRRGNGRIIGSPPARRSVPWQEGGST